MNLAVLSARFAGDASAPPDLLADWFFGAGDVSATSLLESFSGGQMQVEGTVIDAGIVSGAGACPVGGVLDLLSEARANAITAGHDLSSYSHVILALSVPNCGNRAWGIAYLPGTESVVIFAPDRDGGLGAIITHELLHNLGLGHASSLRCNNGEGTPVMIAPDSLCSRNEYGDAFSIMGGGFDMSPGALHKSMLGWLPENSIPLALSDGMYSIRPHNMSGIEAAGLRLVLDDTRSVVLDTWRSGGRTHFGPESPVSVGVTVRIQDGPTTLLLDSLPATESFEDAPLMPGGSVRLGPAGPRIEVVGSTTSGSSVRVSGVLPDTGPPTPVLFVSLDPLEPRGVRLTWPARGFFAARDNVGVAGYRIYRNEALIAEVDDSPYIDAPLEAGTYSYRVAAVDAAGNEGGAAENGVTFFDFAVPAPIPTFDAGSAPISNPSPNPGHPSAGTDGSDGPLDTRAPAATPTSVKTPGSSPSSGFRGLQGPIRVVFSEPERSTGVRVRVSVGQLQINQRISQAAVRRLAALDARLEGRPVPSTVRRNPPGRIRLTTAQLQINQRIAEASLQRAEVLIAKLERRPAPRAAAPKRLALGVPGLRANQRTLQEAIVRVNGIDRALDRAGL